MRLWDISMHQNIIYIAWNLLLYIYTSYANKYYKDIEHHNYVQVLDLLPLTLRTWVSQLQHHQEIDRIHEKFRHYWYFDRNRNQDRREKGDVNYQQQSCSPFDTSLQSWLPLVFLMWYIEGGGYKFSTRTKWQLHRNKSTGSIFFPPLTS